VIQLLLLCLVLLLLTGAIAGWVAVLRLNRTNRRLAALEERLADGTETPSSTAVRPPESATDPAPEPLPKAQTRVPQPSSLQRFGVHITQYWMIWLGGLCVALAGVFLVRYSIEQGLLGPRARVAFGILTGLALHAAAEYLRRRTHENHPAFAALAGGGSITLFAALLASLHLYDLLPPGVVFLALAIVGVVTMALAWWHGPFLAAIGILGAYAVPALVGGDDGHVLIVLAYAAIVSGSALLLLRYVYRQWLWWGFLAGALFWWLLTLWSGEADGFRGVYLALIGYLMLSLPAGDWRLVRPVMLDAEAYDPRQLWQLAPRKRQTVIGCLLLVAAQAMSIFIEDRLDTALTAWSPLMILLLLAARHREPVNTLPWLLLIAETLAFVAMRLDERGGRLTIDLLTGPETVQLLNFAAGTAILVTALSLRNLGACRFKALWASLATLAPLLMLTLTYVLTLRLLVSWQWGSATLLVALAYLGLATAALRKQSVDTLVIWLFFGGHFAFSLAAVMVLDEATLTLAFAVQAISSAWIIRTFALPNLGWLLKLVVVIVLFRLTFNPWLPDYDATTHWTLWAYGGSAACTAISALILRGYPLLSRWGEGAALHLVVLTLWAEVRYWLYDGDVFAAEFDFVEAALYVSLFGSLAIVYYRRSLVSTNIGWLYRWFGWALAVLAASLYAVILYATLTSELWVWNSIGKTPIFNLTLLAYGAPVIIGVAAWYLFDPAWRRIIALFTAIAGFAWISLQIRHLWQGTVRLDLPTSSGELYTYSAVWLLMAITAILGGTWRFGQSCYRAGMLLLGLVILKLFVIDMSGLEGLLRVASFMGLGLALLAINYLHQRLQPRPG